MKGFTLYERGGHLGHVTQMPRTNVRPPTHGGLTQKLALIDQAVCEKKRCEIVAGRRRTMATDHGYTISSSDEPSAQVS